MDESIAYRHATAVDVPAICELGQLLNAIHHAARPEMYTAASHDFSRDAPHWMRFFEAPGQIVFIAHVDGTAAGFITASLSSGRGPLMQTDEIRENWLGMCGRALLGQRYRSQAGDFCPGVGG